MSSKNLSSSVLNMKFMRKKETVDNFNNKNLKELENEGGFYFVIIFILLLIIINCYYTYYYTY